METAIGQIRYYKGIVPVKVLSYHSEERGYYVEEVRTKNRFYTHSIFLCKKTDPNVCIRFY